MRKLWSSNTISSLVYICQLHQHRQSQQKCSRNPYVDKRSQHELCPYNLPIINFESKYHPLCFKFDLRTTCVKDSLN